MNKITISLIAAFLILGFAIGFFVGLYISNNQETEPEVETETAPTETTEELIDPSEWLVTDDEVTEVTEPETTEEFIASTEPTVEDFLPGISVEEFREQWGESAIYIAKTVYGEARGTSVDGQEQVIWCILNRVDHPSFPDTIIEVITAPNQFHGYSSSNPCTDEMYELALDVIYRWQLEKNGGESNRNLGPEYLYFCSDSTGLGNVFRTDW
jgi:hypothetical protein